LTRPRNSEDVLEDVVHLHLLASPDELLGPDRRHHGGRSVQGEHDGHGVVVDLVRRRLVVAVAGEVVAIEPLDGLLLRDLLHQRLQSGQRPVDASTGAAL
jgi:hypothetical protein